MKKLAEVFKAEPFRMLIFVFSLLLFLWPFLPQQDILAYPKLLSYFFLLWLIIILLLFLIAVYISRQAKQSHPGENE